MWAWLKRMLWAADAEWETVAVKDYPDGGEAFVMGMSQPLRVPPGASLRLQYLPPPPGFSPRRDG